MQLNSEYISDQDLTIKEFETDTDFQPKNLALLKIIEKYAGSMDSVLEEFQILIDHNHELQKYLTQITHAVVHPKHKQLSKDTIKLGDSAFLAAWILIQDRRKLVEIHRQWEEKFKLNIFDKKKSDMLDRQWNVIERDIVNVGTLIHLLSHIGQENYHYQCHSLWLLDSLLFSESYGTRTGVSGLSFEHIVEHCKKMPSHVDAYIHNFGKNAFLLGAFIYSTLANMLVLSLINEQSRVLDMFEEVHEQDPFNPFFEVSHSSSQMSIGYYNDNYKKIAVFADDCCTKANFYFKKYHQQTNQEAIHASLKTVFEFQLTSGEKFDIITHVLKPIESNLEYVRQELVFFQFNFESDDKKETPKDPVSIQHGFFSSKNSNYEDRIEQIQRIYPDKHWEINNNDNLYLQTDSSTAEQIAVHFIQNNHGDVEIRHINETVCVIIKNINTSRLKEIPAMLITTDEKMQEFLSIH